MPPAWRSEFDAAGIPAALVLSHDETFANLPVLARKKIVVLLERRVLWVHQSSYPPHPVECVSPRQVDCRDQNLTKPATAIPDISAHSNMGTRDSGSKGNRQCNGGKTALSFVVYDLQAHEHGPDQRASRVSDSAHASLCVPVTSYPTRSQPGLA
jgi:hypothetical protein